jgi:hypothetical protein
MLHYYLEVELPTQLERELAPLARLARRVDVHPGRLAARQRAAEGRVD